MNGLTSFQPRQLTRRRDIGAVRGRTRVKVCPAPLSLRQLERAICALSRAKSESLVERLIDRLDSLDPNPDFEPTGDEWDGNAAEDDFGLPLQRLRYWGPGCAVSDADC